MILFLLLQIGAFFKPHLIKTSSFTYFLPPGSSLTQITTQLKAQKLIRSAIRFKTIVRFLSAEKNLRFGKYQFAQGESEYQVLKKIVYGESVPCRLTLIEGTTFSVFWEQLKNHPGLTKTLDSLNSEQVAQKLHLPSVQPEGWFFPDTYFFQWGEKEDLILQRAHEKMQRQLDMLWENRSPELPYRTPYEALIVASMVEKEAKLPEERPQIAGVILRRLALNMPLQIDSTIIYALGKNYHFPLTHQDLKILSPYNTYRLRGLPPTPIGAPGQAALEAAFHPDHSANLYFVARGDGGHVFSETLQKHIQAIQAIRS